MKYLTTYTLRRLILIIAAGAALAGCSRSDKPSENGDLVAEEVRQRAEAARARLEAGGEGGRLVLKAIEAHGGLEVWYRAPTSAYTWEYANRGADVQFKSYLVAENSARKVYHDLLTVCPYGNPQPVDAGFAWDGSDAWIYPDSIRRVNPHFWALSGYYFEQIPFVLADPGLRYEALPDEELDGEPHDMVRVSFEKGVGGSPGDTYTLYVDKETRMVNAIRYTVSYGRTLEPGDSLRETLFYYEDYVTVDGLTVPTHFRGYGFSNGERGAFGNEAWSDSISFRKPFDASKLIPPEGARLVPPPNAENAE